MSGIWKANAMNVMNGGSGSIAATTMTIADSGSLLFCSSSTEALGRMVLRRGTKAA